MVLSSKIFTASPRSQFFVHPQKLMPLGSFRSQHSRSLMDGVFWVLLAKDRRHGMESLHSMTSRQNVQRACLRQSRYW